MLELEIQLDEIFVQRKIPTYKLYRSIEIVILTVSLKPKNIISDRITAHNGLSPTDLIDNCRSWPTV